MLGILALTHGHAVAAPSIASGSLSIVISSLPAISVARDVEVQVGGLPGSVSGISLPGTQLATTASVPVSDPAAFPIGGIKASIVQGPGAFTGGPAALQGTMPIRGLLHICLFGGCNASVANVDVPLTHAGRGVGLGGDPIMVQGLVNVTVQGAPWTTRTVTVGTATAMGYLDFGGTGGSLQAVTPIVIHTNIGASPTLPAFAILNLSGIPPDADSDGVMDLVDVCPMVADPGQQDTDGDGQGDACNDASDADGDEYADTLDNCPATANPGQEDGDGDAVGDACDPEPARFSDQVTVLRAGLGGAAADLVHVQRDLDEALAIGAECALDLDGCIAARQQCLDQNGSLAAALGTCQAARDGCLVERDLCNADLAATEGFLEDAMVQLDTCRDELADCGGGFGRCSQDLLECQAARDAAESGLAACDADLAAAGADLASCEVSLSAASGQLATCSANLASCSSDLSVAQSDLAARNAELATAEARIAELEAMLAASEQANQGLQAELDQLTTSNEALEAENATLVAELGLRDASLAECEVRLQTCEGNPPNLPCAADLSGDGVVNFRDLGLFKSVFLESCTP